MRSSFVDIRSALGSVACTVKKTILIISVVLNLVLAFPVQAGYEEGKKAFHLGDFDTALREWRDAAEHGNFEAAFDIALMYNLGRGVPLDFVLAHMWYNLAAARGNSLAAEIRGLLSKKMTPAQIAEAERRARV